MYLNQHPNVHHMCYLPIHTAMVCFLYGKMGNRLPRTETEMYTEFTKHTLLRTFSKEKETSLKSVEDIPADEKVMFLNICKLGYQQTIDSKQVMTKTEVEGFFNGVGSGKESMGLITVDRMAGVCGFENLYTFLHLTFQEYLAAYHISKLEQEELSKVLRAHGQKEHMQVVWKFLCGLLRYSGEDKFAELMKATQLKRCGDLFSIQCAFESQQASACDHVVTNGTVSLKGHYLTPADFTAIGYVMQNSTQPVDKLVFDNCRFGQDCIMALLEEVDNKIVLKSLNFHGKSCVVDQYKCLNSLLKSLPCLEVLDISRTDLGPHKIDSLFEGLALPNLYKLTFSAMKQYKGSELSLFRSLNVFNFKCPNLQEVTISRLSSVISCFTVKTIVEIFGLAQLLYGKTALTEVALSEIDSSKFHLLCDGLKENSCCTKLHLTDCHIEDTLCEMLASALKPCNALKELVLMRNRIGNKGALALADALKHLLEISRLDLRYNKICDEGAIAVANTISKLLNCDLLIWNHTLTAAGAATLRQYGVHVDIHCLDLSQASDCVAVLSHLMLLCNRKDTECGSDQVTDSVPLHPANISTNLYTLKLNMHDSLELKIFLKHCSNLQTLTLEQNFIRDDGARALAEGLKHCRNLQTLDLNYSDIGADGARTLAESLKHLSNLQTLNLEGNWQTRKHYSNMKTLNLEGNWQTMNLGHNSIGHDSAWALAESLKHCSNLQTLNLGHNCIDADGARALADCLKHCSILRALNLGHNSIGDDGAKALAKHVKHCSNLQTLNLECSSIGADGARALADGLKHCSILQTLNFKYNNIGENGAKALADGLKQCSNLQILNLYGNSIGPDGARALADGLKQCSNLQILNLYRC